MRTEEAISVPRSLPSVTRLLELCREVGAPRDALVAASRRVLEDARKAVLAGGNTSEVELVRAVRAHVQVAQSSWPARVVNATGVVLHTNLGRAVLSEAARGAMQEAAAYSDLELDLETGERGKRDTHVERLLVELTGAEAATVTNNCAASLFLSLAALAHGREVVVSRGQSVEIGGRFRIPDVCEQSGATLREVGTTNRTYASDYRDAVTEQTALLLKVHRSNFFLSGFVANVDIEEMVGLGDSRSIPVLNDLGSGCMVDTELFGLRHEPTVQESVRAGAGLTLFSGDKLLGGPQAGLIVGRRDLVERVRRHPLARALRCDKVTLAALHATLLHYLRGEHLEQVPTLRMLGLSQAELSGRAQRWRDALALPGVEVVPVASAVGGGSLPDAELPSAALVIDPSHFGVSADEYARRLRAGENPIMARVERDRIWLDPRTVQPDEERVLLESLSKAGQQQAVADADADAARGSA
ncbi:MAG: L-seryl-tRNA(Sec) selenium transferase [Chloroflexota bacterium]|nr:L-seryl-tRNA(Sec) selenium transferase [Chloroflexota bacterium]